MDNATELISVSPAAAPATQLALRLPELDTDDSWLIVDGSSELPDYVQQRMRIIQQLLAARGTKTYTQVQRQAARSLGISVRSLRRLVKAWQELGVAGLSRQPRSDQGSIKASQEWQDFIVKTYKDGNRGSRQMSPGYGNDSDEKGSYRLKPLHSNMSNLETATSERSIEIGVSEELALQ